MTLEVDALVGELLEGEFLHHAGLIALGEGGADIVVVPGDGGAEAEPVTINDAAAVGGEIDGVGGFVGREDDAVDGAYVEGHGGVLLIDGYTLAVDH